MFLGCDVGSSSVRVCLFEFPSGKILNKEVEQIKTWQKGDVFEQSSENIIEMIVRCISRLVSGVGEKKIEGISFDATCSLVAVTKDDEPLSVSESDENERNIIMWCDHRAKIEAAFINSPQNEALKQDVLKFCGGSVSLEMELPKILWLKRNKKETYQKSNFFDLADYLVYRFSGKDVRSVTTNVCKWGYLAHLNEWNEGYFKSIDLEDLCLKLKDKIIREPGTRVGSLTAEMAKKMGVHQACVVSTGIIDAHAGGLGTLCFTNENQEVRSCFDVLALIGGTSTCHMASTKEAVFVNGVWGPYWNAMVKDTFLLEGGQSSSSTLLDRLVHNHPCYAQCVAESEKRGLFVYDLLNEKVASLHQRIGHDMTKHLHVGPDFHGNRSPLADVEMKGSIIGLSLDDQNEDGLVMLYCAAVQSLAYGTRAIIEEIEKKSNRKILAIHATGGLSKNALWLQEHANVTQKVVTVSDTDAVLLGASVLAVAGAREMEVNEVIQKTRISARDIIPQQHTKQFHDQKFQIFKMMQQDQKKYRDLIN